MKSLRERFTEALPPDTPYETITELWRSVGAWLHDLDALWGDDEDANTTGDTAYAWEVDGQ